MMETSQDFRKFAWECTRLASQEAVTEKQRSLLKEMAAAWNKVAEEYDQERSLKRVR
jgi:hypothetical protein